VERGGDDGEVRDDDSMASPRSIVRPDGPLQSASLTRAVVEVGRGGAEEVHGLGKRLVAERGVDVDGEGE